MYLRIKGDLVTVNAVYEIRTITDHATLRFGAMEYNEDKGIVSLPIVRYKMRAVKRMHFWTKYKYDFAVRIPALIVIRNVIHCAVKNRFDDPTIREARLGWPGFVVDFEKRQIGIASVEEAEGKRCYEVDTYVNEIDIEIKDEDAAI